jgi:hypothetical protein
MSIFKSTFSPFVKEQLDRRQNAISTRTAPNLQYYNSRNAWIRMVSSVNVNGSAELAKNYILQGGTLTKDKTLKSGLGDFQNAYSNKAYDGTPYRLGIRPMPGIISLNIKSKSAYGSLREAVVSFQCWDIKQLEDLELLYMRPGYTVLVEWGWAPYLDNSGGYQPNFNDYYDILDKPPTERTVLFRELYEKSKKYGGNYDAMFGYIKNYQWSARMDGGYDCQVTVISTGELIESLKVNYLNPTSITDNTGLLNVEFENQGNEFDRWRGAYNQNILTGIWAEAYYKLTKGRLYANSPFIDNYESIINLILSSPDQQKKRPLSEYGEVYITLGCMVDILNKYVIAKGSDKKPLIELSLDSTTYDDTTKSDLLCTAHPLQVSVDPSICIIKSPLWSGGEIITQAAQSLEEDETIVESQGIIDKLIEASSGTTDEELLTESIERIKNRELYIAVKQKLQIIEDQDFNSLEKIFNEELDNVDESYAERISIALGKIGVVASYDRDPGDRRYLIKGTFKIDDTSLDNVNTNAASSQVNIVQNAPQALANIEFIKSFQKDYFFQNEYNEIGVIKNIYVNINFLYEQALDASLQNADSKEKNEISLFNYIKKIISAIQAAIGNVNNFGIHVDPVDNNVARIIDINYTEYPKAKYEDLFLLKIQTLGSVVRSYSLQSQIFPDQSSAIAIGAQAKGGQLGIQNNTMIDFNKNLTDRIIPTKTDAQESDLKISQNGDKSTANITNALSNIITLFSALDGQTSVDTSNTDYNTIASGAKNSLRDLIVYFQSITSSPGSNRNLIPTKFSCEMDGIGGLVIGHMFRLPDEVMPKGYRGVQGIGVQLGNAITSIGHTISNGDWVTRIDSLNIVMDFPDPEGIEFRQLSLDLIKAAFNAALTGNGNSSFSVNNVSTDGSVAEDSQKYPVLVKYFAWRNEYNSTVQKYAKVSDKTPVADALRSALDKQYITEKGGELSSNGDITEALKSAVLTFQSNLISTAGFEFIKSKPIRITAGNDTYHRTYGEKRNRTTHSRGIAIDIGTREFTQTQINSIMALLKSSGFTYVIYHGGSALHIHANLSTK